MLSITAEKSNKTENMKKKLEINKIKSPIKLNMGSGGKVRVGYIGIDANPGEGVDIQIKVEDIENYFGKNSVDKIYSRHMLEHLSRKKAPLVIRSWVNILKIGGEIELNFPDLDRYVKFYYKNKKKIPVEEFARWIYGNQKDKYDFHKAGFNGEYIASILKRAGMKILSVEPAKVGNGLPPENKAMIGTVVKALKK